MNGTILHGLEYHTVEVDRCFVRKVVMYIKLNVITLVQSKLRARELAVGEDHFSGSTRSIMPVRPRQGDFEPNRSHRACWQDLSLGPLGKAKENQTPKLAEGLHLAWPGWKTCELLSGMRLQEEWF